MAKKLVGSSNRPVAVLAPVLLVFFRVNPKASGLSKVLFQVRSAFEELAAGLVAAEVVWLLVAGEAVRHLASRGFCVLRRSGLLELKRFLGLLRATGARIRCFAVDRERWEWG